LNESALERILFEWLFTAYVELKPLPRFYRVSSGWHESYP